MIADEFLLRALTTCYGNDSYRKAAHLQIEIHGVEVVVSAEFNEIGLAATNLGCQARVQADAPSERVEQPLKQMGAMAQLHNMVCGAITVIVVIWQGSV